VEMPGRQVLLSCSWLCCW